MTITDHGPRESRGRPPIGEVPLPANIQQALVLRSVALAGKMQLPQRVWSTEHWAETLNSTLMRLSF